MNVRPDDLDDRALVERFKETRDQECFTALYERHKGHIYALCNRLVRNHALAEDIMQETFVKAFRWIDRFDPARPFGAWLTLIGKRLCLSELRRMKVRERIIPGQHGYDPPDQEVILTVFQLEAELSALPKEARRCYLLLKMDGYTHKEIADLTGYSFQQVKNYIRIAREKLEKQSK
jgi:RNA polymerase sigma-70 factor (ECF subfamily)